MGCLRPVAGQHHAPVGQPQHDALRRQHRLGAERHRTRADHLGADAGPEPACGQGVLLGQAGEAEVGAVAGQRIGRRPVDCNARSARFGAGGFEQRGQALGFFVEAVLVAVGQRDHHQPGGDGDDRQHHKQLDQREAAAQRQTAMAQTAIARSRCPHRCLRPPPCRRRRN
jgi:hypothetical protein